MLSEKAIQQGRRAKRPGSDPVGSMRTFLTEDEVWWLLQPEEMAQCRCENV